MLTQTAAHLAVVKKPSEGDVQRVEDTIRRLIASGHLGSKFARAPVGELVELVCSWFISANRKLKSVSTELHKVYKQSRVLLRGTDPKLWIAVAQAYPELSPTVCKILIKWPLNYQDRDFLVDAAATVLPALAFPATPTNAVAGCELAVMLSCGSELRVARLEKELLSANVAEAFRLYGESDDVAIPAIGYLFNVAQCEDLWPTVVKLGVGSLCRSALQRFHDHPLVPKFAQYILDVLHYMEYGGDS
jgi:hypothetical protein